MNRKFVILNYVITFLVTIGAVVFVVLFFNNKYSLSFWNVVGFYTLGLLVSSFICALLHEFGHLVFGKVKGFILSSFSVWFLRWDNSCKKLRFSLRFLFEEAGSTEMIKKDVSGMEKGLKFMTVGGLIFSLISAMISLPVFIISVPYQVYCVLAVFLPVGLYFFVGNAIPSSEGRVRNDGGVLYGLKKGDNETKVTLSLLSIQTELFNGKTFSEIDGKYYFEVPQLPEDSLNFITLLTYRYNYYLDVKDYENAKKTTSRLLTLEEYMPKSFKYVVKSDALYNACTFNLNEEVADDLTYEIEDVLNKDESVTSYRVRLAYIALIKGERQILEAFYNKAIKRANKCQLSGLKRFEIKLINELYSNF